MNQHQEVNGAAWEFFLYINNQTSKELVVDNIQLDWGYWYRDCKDDCTPISIKPGETVQALGIRAAKGTWTGYECRCRWSAKGEDKKNIFSIDVKIDVPFSADNTSSLTVSGDILAEGWTDLPARGHNFTRTIAISEVDSVSLEDEEECQYYEMLSASSDIVESWERLQSELAEIKQFDPREMVPKAYLYPPESIFLGRTKISSIPRGNWNQLKDPKYDFEWQKKKHVENYYSVAIFSVNTNPRSTISIPAGKETVTETTVEVTSALKHTLTQNMSLKMLLSGKKSGLSAELELEYSISDVLEESSSRVERATETVTIPVSDKNRIFVPWVFSTAVAVYREKKDGTVSLIGISEWAEEIVDMVYEH